MSGTSLVYEQKWVRNIRMEALCNKHNEYKKYNKGSRRTKVFVYK